MGILCRICACRGPEVGAAQSARQACLEPEMLLNTGLQGKEKAVFGWVNLIQIKDKARGMTDAQRGAGTKSLIYCREPRFGGFRSVPVACGGVSFAAGRWCVAVGDRQRRRRSNSRLYSTMRHDASHRNKVVLESACFIGVGLRWGASPSVRPAGRVLLRACDKRGACGERRLRFVSEFSNSRILDPWAASA